LRNGAQAGDFIYVSGTIGDAALGLAALKGELEGASAADCAFLIDRYRLPRPRVLLGQKLVGVASAMIDVSDGLVGDLKHICTASGLAASIQVDNVPLSESAYNILKKLDNSTTRILGGGDDYELLFTSRPGMALKMGAAVQEAGLTVTCIGKMEAGEGVKVLDAKGKPIRIDVAGYSHF
jgi:thiamine-monophosphate kinase